jgi:hypothetical protein
VTSDRTSSNRPVEIDYDVYAAAEAELGWYNGRCEVVLPNKVDTYDIAMRILRDLSSKYETDDVAHVKLMLVSESNALKISLVCQNVNVDGVKGSRYGSGKCYLTINARVISSPDRLRTAVREAVASSLARFGLREESIEDDSFSPSRPRPTYRMG